MKTRILVISSADYLFIILLLTSSLPLYASASLSPSPSFPLNISNFLYPHSSSSVLHDHESNTQSPPFLLDVLKGIREKEKWDLKDVKITELDLKNTKVRTIRRYEFRVKFGRGEVVFKLFDKVSPWERFRRSEEGSDFEASVREISSKAVLESFKIQGPFQLRVVGDSKLNLILPRNASVAGMKHIIVREGITVEVNGAEEVSLIHTDHVHKSVERRSFGYLWLHYAWPCFLCAF